MKPGILFLFIFLSSFSLFGNTIKLISPKDEITFNSGSEAYLPVKLSISEEGYIYSNPKGPGTGKPVNFSVTGIQGVQNIYITPPQQYISPLSEEWVWIHKGDTTLYLPVTQNLNNKTNASIHIDALYCNDATCTPVSDTITVTLIPAEKNDKTLVSSLPEEFHTISLSKNTATSPANTRNFEGTTFSPNYLDKAIISSLLPAILTAFVAGLILNVMPCVLPVIGIKIMSLMKMHSESRKMLAVHGLMYTAGVIFSFLVLASLAAFAGANWGSLFQSRGFIVIMAVIIFSLALSMLGVYTLQTPLFITKISPSSSVITTSFMNGLLATILATPCSGPFLGATLTWTLTQSTSVIFAVFTSIGAGLAFPFLLISLFPSLLQKLPKGGNWSIIFERIIGFILIGSVIYFLSTLNEQYILFTLIILLFASIGLWQFGKFHLPESRPLTRKLSVYTLVILIAAGILTSRTLVFSSDDTVISYEEFSYTKLENRVKSGSIVFVQFTADWCPNCAYLEAAVLHTAQFNELLEKNSVLYLKADLTESGTEGEKLLEKLGSKSIPYAAVFYPGSFESPVALRDMFSIDDVTAAVTHAVENAEYSSDKEQLQIEIITM